MISEDRLLRYRERLEYVGKRAINLHEWTEHIKRDILVESLNLQDKYGIHHAFQLSIDKWRDLIAMMVRDVSSLPRDDTHNIKILIENGVISPHRGKDLKRGIELRHKIIHGYNGLNDLIALERIVYLIEHLDKFMEEVETWLENNS